MRTKEEAAAAGALFLGDYRDESWLGVPIQAGDDIIGVLAVESDQPVRLRRRTICASCRRSVRVPA